jgi:hypothetical protein
MRVLDGDSQERTVQEVSTRTVPSVEYRHTCPQEGWLRRLTLGILQQVSCCHCWHQLTCRVGGIGRGHVRPLHPPLAALPLHPLHSQRQFLPQGLQLYDPSAFPVPVPGRQGWGRGSRSPTSSLPSALDP